MEPDQLRDAIVPEFLEPEHWLVLALEWAGGHNVSEAALAVAPATFPREAVSAHCQQVLGCADRYARKHAISLVFFSDLTRMFMEAVISWVGLCVDWQAALSELEQARTRRCCLPSPSEPIS